MAESRNRRAQRKTEQLQIRVTSEEKAEIRVRAKRAGMDVSSWVLHQALPPAAQAFQRLCSDLARDDGASSFVFAELNDLLSGLRGNELARTVEQAPVTELPEFEAAYVAAMVEQAASVRGIRPPPWTAKVKAVDLPWFASTLLSLRLHLLTASPAPFRRRNIFIDTALGGRV